MLTDEQRKELSEKMKQGVGRVSEVSAELMDAYPAEVKEISVPTSEGDTKVYQYS